MIRHDYYTQLSVALKKLSILPPELCQIIAKYNSYTAYHLHDGMVGNIIYFPWLMAEYRSNGLQLAVPLEGPTFGRPNFPYTLRGKFLVAQRDKTTCLYGYIEDTVSPEHVLEYLQKLNSKK